MAVALAFIAIIISVAAYVGYRQVWDSRELERFTDAMERVEVILNRMELATYVVASDLREAEGMVALVAQDLKDAQARADDVMDGHPGEAADAGAQSGTNGNGHGEDPVDPRR